MNRNLPKKDKSQESDRTVAPLGKRRFRCKSPDQSGRNTKLYCVMIGYNWTTVSSKELPAPWIPEAQESGREGSDAMLRRRWSSLDWQPEAREDFKHLVWQ